MINSQMKGKTFGFSSVQFQIDYEANSLHSTTKIENKTGHFLQLFLNQFSTTILYRYQIGPNRSMDPYISDRALDPFISKLKNNIRIEFLIVKSLNILIEKIFVLGSVKNLVFRDWYLLFREEFWTLVVQTVHN